MISLKINFSVQNGAKWYFSFSDWRIRWVSPNIAGSSKTVEYALEGWRIVKKINPDKGAWHNG